MHLYDLFSLNDSLKANNKNFYFDYKNGKYGYNTSSSRGADTFVPFSGGNGLKIKYMKITGTSGNIGGITDSTIETKNCSKITGTLKFVNIRQYGHVSGNPKTGYCQFYFTDMSGNIIKSFTPTTNTGWANAEQTILEYVSFDHTLNVDISAYDSIKFVCHTLEGYAELHNFEIG